MSVLILAEHDNAKLNQATQSAINAAKQLETAITVLVAGFQCDSPAKEVAEIKGVAKVILADNACYEHGLAENMTPLLVELASSYEYIVAPATTYGKNIMPRVAALLDVSQLTDVCEILDKETFKRPIYAGNAITTITTQDKIKLLTVRQANFSTECEAQPACPIEKTALVFDKQQSQFVERQLSQSERPELSSARVVISGGRGLQSADNFQLLEKLAAQLNAAIGASRAAVDAGYVPNDYQVGQTGKIVAPDLYIAVGISGAIQHIAGMKEAKVIVAINKDEDAPIFKIADYGLVGDLFDIVPKFSELLEKNHD